MSHRNRSPEYIAVADRLLRLSFPPGVTDPGTCSREGCGKDLVGFTAGDVDNTSFETMLASTLELHRFGCPVHDIHAWEYVGNREALAALRHESDPMWAWAPEGWRPAIAREGWGLPGPSPHPRLLCGEYGGLVWVATRKVMLALPLGFTTLTKLEDGLGVAPDWRAQYRLTAEDIAPQLDLKGYAPAERRKPSDLGWQPWVDPGHVAFGRTIVPKGIVEMVEGFEPHPWVRWVSRGDLEPVRALDAGGMVVAVVGAMAETTVIDRSGDKPAEPAQVEATGA